MKIRDNSVCLNEDFGNFIRTARERKGIFQGELAQMVGVRQPYISMIEHGERNVDLTLALKLCEALGININDFIKRYVRPKTRRRTRGKHK
jgi:transcriptional regulator with XRE-family HTH domain